MTEVYTCTYDFALLSFLSPIHELAPSEATPVLRDMLACLYFSMSAEPSYDNPSAGTQWRTGAYEPIEVGNVGCYAGTGNCFL